MKYLFLNIALFILYITAHQPIVCQAGNSLANRIAEIAENHAASDNFSGSVLVATNGEQVYQKTFGVVRNAKKSVRLTRKRLRPSLRFRWITTAAGSDIAPNTRIISPAKINTQ